MTESRRREIFKSSPCDLSVWFWWHLYVGEPLQRHLPLGPSPPQTHPLVCPGPSTSGNPCWTIRDDLSHRQEAGGQRHLGSPTGRETEVEAVAVGRNCLRGWAPARLMPWKHSGGQRHVDRSFTIFEHSKLESVVHEIFVDGPNFTLLLIGAEKHRSQQYKSWAP